MTASRRPALRDFSRWPQGPRGDAVEALRGLLRSLGVQDAYLPATLPELSGLYLGRTAGEAVLVVVEGVDEPANVRLLIPNAPGSTVVAASDAATLDELVLDGAWFLTFEPLTTETSCELLVSASGRTPATPQGNAAFNLAYQGLLPEVAALYRRPGGDCGLCVAESAASGSGERLRV